MIENEKSLVKTLNTRLNALKRISRNASFKTRLMVGNACFMSVISYMIAVWGGTESYVVRAVQVMQNKAARCITKLSWFTPTRSLLLQCNWLSIKQLMFFHTALQVWKVQKWKKPVYIHSKLQPSKTRSATHGTLVISVAEKTITRKSFMSRAALTWNAIPADIRNKQKLTTFKKELKTWVKVNIDIE